MRARCCGTSVTVATSTVARSMFALSLTVIASFLTIAFLVGCAASRQTFRVESTTPGPQIVMIEAGDFYFRPGVIQAKPGMVLMLQVTNTSGRRHNVSVKDPGGNVMVSRDMDAGQTVSFTVALEESGNYKIYCDEKFHPTLGMKGRIEVASPEKPS